MMVDKTNRSESESYAYIVHIIDDLMHISPEANVHINSSIRDRDSLDAFNAFCEKYKNEKSFEFKFVDDEYYKSFSLEQIKLNEGKNIDAFASISFPIPPSEWSDDVRARKSVSEKSYLTDKQQEILSILADIMSVGISKEQAQSLLKKLKEKYIITKKKNDDEQ